MENVFEEMLGSSTDTNVEEPTNEEVETNSEFDLTNDDLQFDDTDTADEADDDYEDDDVQINPTNQAFAQMRTQNKEYSQKLSELDELAKSLGMKDADEFMAKAKATQIQRAAQTKGIPVEVEQELQEMRELKDSILADKAESERIEKERNFASTVHDFVDKNGLSKSAIDKLSQDLENDGFAIDMLMEMPKAAVVKVLNSYVGTSYQKNLERKERAIQELPVNQSSKIDADSVNKELDNLAKQLAGKI